MPGTRATTALVTGGASGIERLRLAGNDVVVWHLSGGLALHSPIDAYGQLRRLMARKPDEK